MSQTFLTLKYYVIFSCTKMKKELVLTLAAILVLGALVSGLSMAPQSAFADDDGDGGSSAAAAASSGGDDGDGGSSAAAAASSGGDDGDGGSSAAAAASSD